MIILALTFTLTLIVANNTVKSIGHNEKKYTCTSDYVLMTGKQCLGTPFTGQYVPVCPKEKRKRGILAIREPAYVPGGEP